MDTHKWILAALVFGLTSAFGTTLVAQGTPPPDSAETQNAEANEAASAGDSAAGETTAGDEGASEDMSDSTQTDKTGDFETNQGAEDDSSTVKAPAEFGLNMDLMLAAGFGSLLYPHIEPSIDIGVAPLGPVTFSVGGSVDVGYCLLCGVITAVSDWRVNSWYWSLQGRALIHFNQLTRMAQDSFNADLYAGLSLGPQFYNFKLGYKPTDDAASANLVTFLGGPVFGIRIFGDNVGLFGYAELRYFIEAGFNETRVEINDQEFTITSDYRRGGSDITLGFGYRF